jgi:hypothetical protein
LLPLAAFCALARRGLHWREAHLVAVACVIAGGYIVLDGSLRVSTPVSARVLLLGASFWTIGRRVLLSALYAGVIGWGLSRVLPAEGRSARQVLGLGGRATRGLPVAIVAAGIVTLPWPVTGALGDSLTSLNVLLDAAASVVPEQIIFWGMVYSLLARASMRPRIIAIVTSAVYAASALGEALVGGGLGDLSSTVSRLPLALLLWQLRAQGGSLFASLAAAYLSSAIPRLFVDPRDAVAAGIPEPQHTLARSIGLVAMVALALVFGVGARLLARFRHRRGLEDRSFRRAASGAAAGLCIAWLAVYLLVGAPGFHNHGFLIVMAEQAEVESCRPGRARDECLARLYRSLVDAAESSQSALRSELDGLGVPYRPYYLINMIRVDGHRWLMRRFWRRPGVSQVLLNPNVRPYPRRIEFPYGPDLDYGSGVQANLAAIHADASWSQGVLGQGIVVGGQDTGFDWDHPALVNQYRGWDGHGAVHDYNWHDAWGGAPEPFDDGTHGTHTMGIVLGDDGNGNLTGVAPQAQWAGCRNMRRGLGNPASYLECMEFFFAPYPRGGDPFRDGDVAMAPHVVNNSWACPDFEGCQPDTLKPALDVLRAAGIMMIASAGNEGPECASIAIPPATYGSVFSVASTTDDAVVSGFSSRGPAGSLIKPDVSAPGDWVRSSTAGGGYGYAGGTSMAGPHVAGLVALLWSADSELIGDIERTEALICGTAIPRPVEAACSRDGEVGRAALAGLFERPECACGDEYGVPNNVYGCGFIDAGAAVHVALGE